MSAFTRRSSPWRMTPGTHVNTVHFLGLGGHKDWQLMTRIRREDYTFVPNVTPSLERELFLAALSHIGERDLIRALLEVDLAGSTATCREYPYPLLPPNYRAPSAS
jgi:hypothetical protein